MRKKLILSFAFVTLVSIVSVVLIARRSAAREVQAFMYRGSMVEVDSLVEDLEAYYRAAGSWDGVESLLPGGGQGQVRGQGAQNQGLGSMAMMHNQRLLLADQAGEVLVDTSGTAAGTTLSQAELDAAQPLRAGGRVAGYLQVESGMMMTGAAGSFLLARLNRAALIAGVIAGGLALFLALLLSDRLLQPIKQLTGAARKMAKGDLAQRVPVARR